MLKQFTIFFAGLLAFLALSGVSPAYARQPSLDSANLTTPAGATKAALTLQLEKMQAALQGDDVDLIVQALAPPAMRRASGLGLGLTEAQLPAFDKHLIAMTKQTLSQATIGEFSIDYAAIDYNKSDRGVSYAYVPYSMTMNVMAKDFLSSGKYIALVKDEEWVVLSPTDANTVRLLKMAFPELRDISITPTKLEAK
jgi:hypothetical protein